jgi:hypothetical protein
MITISEYHTYIQKANKIYLGLGLSCHYDYMNQMIALTVITLGNFQCIFLMMACNGETSPSVNRLSEITKGNKNITVLRCKSESESESNFC